MTLTSRSRPLLFAVFLFFYLPMVYYGGWVLTKGISVDFPSYYHAARMVFVEGRSPYGAEAFQSVSLAMGRKVHPFLYPPPSLIAFWPFARLSLIAAQNAFLIVSHLCYLGTIWLMLAKLIPLPADQRSREIMVGVSLIYILSFDAVMKTFGLGQVNLIVLFFVCLALAGLKENSSAWRVALPLSIAILLKTYPVLLLAPLLFRRKFRVVGLTCAFFGLFAGVAALVVPGAAWRDWLLQILPNGGYANNAISAGFLWNQSINGWATRLLVTSEFGRARLAYPWLARPLATGLAALVVGATLFFSYRLSRRGLEGAWDEEMAAYLLLIFMVAPLSWDHHMVYVLPAGVWAIGLLLNGSVRRGASVAVVAVLFLFAWYIPLDYPEWERGWWTLLRSMKLYPVVGLWVFFISRMRRIMAADAR